ncbi:YidH family protein [Paraburkholderia fungorum]|uniref:YidH family protein n=1 Tax=Paraburkholderia fungorum TaxID=134537 RepID=UPI0038BDFFAE
MLLESSRSVCVGLISYSAAHIVAPGFHAALPGHQTHPEYGVARAPARTSDQLAGDRTDLAANRTLMAADRTLMAWIRTGLSMISFGFTIYKVLQGFTDAGIHLAHPHSPRVIGLFLTGIGTVSMALGTIEYWTTISSLRERQSISVWRPTFFIALVMACSGSFVFLSIIIRLL